MREEKPSHSSIGIFTEPFEFFRHLLTSAIQNQKVIVQPETEYYLVSLLTKYMKSETMQKSQEDPLAITLHKALLSTSSPERIQLLKEIGDFSLYVSGFFSDSFNRKIIDIDYYMAMGGVAYNTLSSNSARSVLFTLFKDLADRFTTFADILAEVSDRTFSHSNKDILRLYEKWLKTKSERLANLLKKEGIFPLSSLTIEVN